MLRFFCAIGWFAASLLTAEAAVAADLPPLTGEVILTVSGLDPKKFEGGQVAFDLGRMAALGETHVHTSTIWTEGVHDYTGVSLKDLTGFLGLTEGILTGMAINDYAVEIPVSDAVEGGPILAYAQDGVMMSVRDKGPIWVIYPFDMNPDYRSEVIFSRSIWQLDRIEVTP
jgi:hypothetical protein